MASNIGKISAWSEKYRPTTINDVVCTKYIKKQLESYVTDKEVPHIILVAPAGVGKTTIAKALVNDIGAEYIYINASNDNGIDILRSKIIDFMKQRSPFGNSTKKIIILDEFDYASPNLQAALRSPMEQFSSVARFIFTANYGSKIIDAIKSRSIEIDLNVAPKNHKDVIRLAVTRIVHILKQEEIIFDLDVIFKLVEKYYPDFRSLLNTLQNYATVNNGTIDASVLQHISDTNKVETDKLVSCILDKDFGICRRIIIDNQMTGEQLYPLLYRELLPKIESPDAYFSILTLIEEFQYRYAFAIDKEINMACAILNIISNI